MAAKRNKGQYGEDCKSSIVKLTGGRNGVMDVMGAGSGAVGAAEAAGAAGGATGVAAAGADVGTGS
jgi:hypothetical protein